MRVTTGNILVVPTNPASDGTGGAGMACKKGFIDVVMCRERGKSDCKSVKQISPISCSPGDFQLFFPFSGWHFGMVLNGLKKEKKRPAFTSKVARSSSSAAIEGNCVSESEKFVWHT